MVLMELIHWEEKLTSDRLRCNCRIYIVIGHLHDLED